MRRLLAAEFVLPLALSLANTSFAFTCLSGDEFNGREAAMAALDGRLTCTDGSKASPAILRVVPLEHCSTAGVRGDIDVFGFSWNLRSVKQLSNTQFLIDTDGTTSALSCVLDRPVLPRADLNKAKEAADYMYAKVVGYSGRRVLDYMGSEIDRRDYRAVGRVEFKATTERYDRSSPTPYNIRVEVVDGKVLSVTMEASAN